MKNVGFAGSTGEGWSAFLLVILGVAQQAGWVPAEADSAALIAAVVLIVNTALFTLRKAFRKGSTPFVSDAPQ